MIPISTTKDKMTFGIFGILVNWGSIKNHDCRCLKIWARGHQHEQNDFLGFKTIGFSGNWKKQKNDGGILLHLK